MFDLSFAHMAIIVVVALVVLGPKELPNALRWELETRRTLIFLGKTHKRWKLFRDADPFWM